LTGLVGRRNINAASPQGVQVLTQVDVAQLPVAGQGRVTQVAFQDFGANCWPAATPRGD
jgi:hypothetical protein